MKSSIRVIAAAVVIASCVLPGCRRSTTYVTEDGTRAEVTRSGNQTDVTIEGKDGAKMVFSTGGEVSLPDGFPKDVPLYPGASTMFSATTPQGMQVGLKTKDGVDKVVRFYQEKIKAADWQIDTSMNSQEGGMLSAKKASNTLLVTVTGESDGTQIVLVIQREQ